MTGARLERRGDEQRDNGAILRFQVLTRSEDIEVAQHDRLEPMSRKKAWQYASPASFAAA